MIGELSLSLKDLYSLDYREIFAIIKGHNRKIEREKNGIEIQKRVTYESGRLWTYFTLCAMPLKHYPNSPEDLIRFDWEKKRKKQKRKIMSKAERYKFQLRFIK